MIPYSRQNITPADIKAVVKVLKSDFITQGPSILAFEKALARTAGVQHAVAYSSGTAALHGAYFAAGIGEGDEVIVPALTFAATANAVLYVGAKPVFADIDPETGNIDPKDVEKKITERTKAIVAVDYAGRPADIEEIAEIARKHKLLFIEDAAHSLGATYKGKSVGAQADMTMFSFHPVKSITTGEGGAIVTNSETFFKKLVAFRTHGIVKDKTLFKKNDAPAWHQEMQMLGFNYRLTDMQAALGLSQMKNLKKNVAKRRSLAKRYHALLKDTLGVTRPLPESAYETSAWHLYPIRVPANSRNEIFDALRKAQIGVQVHYPVVYLHPYYQSLGYTKGLCPNAEAFSDSELSIPLFPGLTPSEQNKIVRELRKVV